MASIRSKRSLASVLKKKQSLASALPKNLPASFLRQITNDFSAEQELCRSVFGIVYQGILPDGSLIAVKRLTENSPVPPSEVFETEVANLMKLKHKNIVELVGSCLEAQKRLVEHKGRFVFEEVVVSCLCYKYPPKGSLEKHFNADTRSFDWETRFKIIMGICEGLHFLHKALDEPIIHMNLVPNSIWLDDNWVPKIADFCHSRLFGQEATRMHTINAKEYIGYMAPECEISTMSDIYSLGMLILEITTGEKNCPDAKDRSARRYVKKVHQLWMANEIIKCNYPLLDSNHLQEVKACIEIGLKCVEADRNKRPSIVDIVGKLNGKRVSSLLDQAAADLLSLKEIIGSMQLSCLFEKKTNTNTAELIGIEEAVNGLMNILTEGNELSMEQGKIVSIVGLGGLGKTTLAHAIYQKLKAQFNCYAFVSVSQNPDMKKLFKCMLYQLGKKSNANIHESILDERLLVYELIEFLQKRRYFIVVDGIWDISVWKMIRCALPTNNGGYIIITTTRIFDVAKQVGGAYYKMPNLCLQNSRILYNRRIFEIEDKDKDEFIKVSERILHKCGGVPLAIIMISGLLATKGGNIEECYKVCNSLGRTTIKDSLDDDENMKRILSLSYDDLPDDENMKRILSLSYDDLPSHLRTCLLYLSVFPDGYEIGKDRLIRIWIAEDLIQCEKQGESLFEIGERYYYELIDRGMIQPVYKRWYYDMTENCRVHDMVFELICDLSRKENFVSILDHVHHTFPSKEIIQRLSLQNCMVDHATHRATMSMQEVRSVVVFPSAVNILPALASFRVLRVLDLQSCCLSQGYSLKYLENLVDLRYLGLRDTGISQLSREIGKLQFLQTLDVTGNEISSLPSTVVELKHLMCLRIDSWTRAPCGIGSFTSLEELSTLCIQDSTDLTEGLGNQTELRVLGIDCHTGWNFKRFEKSLVECLHKLQKLHTLSISVVGECKLDAWVAPPHLRRLEITGCCSSTLSAWLNPLLLQELSFLSIEVRKLRQEDLKILGSLPALVYLDVEVGNQNHGILRRLVFHDSSFPCLVHCVLRGYIGPVAFQQGAMVKLARLHLEIEIPVLETREIAGGFEFGLGNLPVLQDVTFLLRRGGAGEGEVEEAERALRRAIEMHPKHPTLEIL